MLQPKEKGQVVSGDIYGEEEDEDIKVWAEIYEYILSILPLISHSPPIDVILIFQDEAVYNLTSSYVKNLQVKFVTPFSAFPQYHSQNFFFFPYHPA